MGLSLHCFAVERVACAARYSLQTHIVVFGKGFAQRKGEYDQHKVHNAGDNDANDELALPYQPLGEDLIAALQEREREINQLLLTI